MRRGPLLIQSRSIDPSTTVRRASASITKSLDRSKAGREKAGTGQAGRVNQPRPRGDPVDPCRPPPDPPGPNLPSRFASSDQQEHGPASFIPRQRVIVEPLLAGDRLDDALDRQSGIQEAVNNGLLDAGL